MTTQIRVVHVITGLSVGGAELALYRLAAAMDRQQFHSLVVALGTEGRVGELIRAAGIEVRSLGMSRRPARGLVALARLLRDAQPDIVQTWMYHANLIGTLGARLAAVRRLVWNVRTSDFVGRHPSRAIRFVSALCALATRTRLAPDVVVVNSEAGLTVHSALGYRARRWEVIPNGFDPERFRPDAAVRAEVRRGLGVRGEVPLVGHVARLDPMKDHDGFLRAMALVRAEWPGVRCVLAGPGVDAGSALARRIAALGLNGCAQLLGERLDVSRLLAAVDVFISSSKYGEGFSNAIGEAMACGVPCVVTDVGDSAAIIGGTGFVVPPGDPVALAAAVRRVLAMSADQRQELGRAARERVRERFHLPVIVERYEALYRELAAR